MKYTSISTNPCFISHIIYEYVKVYRVVTPIGSIVWSNNYFSSWDIMVTAPSMPELFQKQNELDEKKEERHNFLQWRNPSQTFHTEPERHSSGTRDRHCQKNPIDWRRNWHHTTIAKTQWSWINAKGRKWTQKSIRRNLARFENRKNNEGPCVVIRHKFHLYLISVMLVMSWIVLQKRTQW